MSMIWRLLRRVLVGMGLAAGAALWAAARPRRAPAAPSGLEWSDLPPPLPPGRLVAVPGRGEVFVRELPGPGGAAPTVVLLHTFMYPADTNWFGVYDALGEDARVVAVDFRGHGRGSRPSAPFRFVDVADDLAALLTTLEATPAILVGYSMGGPVALLTWQRRPDVVSGLVLAATTATFDSRLLRLLLRTMGVLQIVMRLLPRNAIERLLARQATGELPVQVTRMISKETPPEVIARLPWLVGESLRGSPEDVAEAGREMAKFDVRGLLPTVDVPAAVLRTTRDQYIAPELQADLAAALGVEPVDLDYAHDAVLAGRQDFVKALRSAVASVADRAR